jgi:hypothetical protein
VREKRRRWPCLPERKSPRGSCPPALARQGRTDLRSIRRSEPQPRAGPNPMVVNTRENKILSSYDPRAFLRYVLAQYVKEGVSERDQAKPPILLELKYRSVEDATTQLGSVGRIRDAFIGFQRHLYD